MLEQVLNEYKKNLTPDPKIKSRVWSSISTSEVFSKMEKQKKSFNWNLALKIGIPVMFVFMMVSLLGGAWVVRKYYLDEEDELDETQDSAEKTELTYASSCEDLKKQFEEYEDMTTGARGGLGDAMLFAPGAMEESKEAGDEAAPSYYTETNVQVEGIDEGDIVKTDGKRLFVLSEGSGVISMLEVYPFNEAEKKSELDLDNENPVEMFLYGDRLVVFSDVYSVRAYGDLEEEEIGLPSPDSNVSKLSLYDVSDLENPKLLRAIDVEGSFLTSRLKEGYVYMITNEYAYDYDSPVPLYRDSLKGDDFEKSCLCEDVAILDEEYVYPSFTTVVALDLSDDNADPEISNFVGDTETVYMGEDNLYLVTNRYVYSRGGIPIIGELLGGESYYESKNYTVVNKLSYSEDNIDFVASTRFEGSLLNQFSLDEHEEHLRLAGTRGESWDNTSKNFLYIYDADMSLVSQIDNLAKGESIYSARFYGDTGVVVTFKKIDPLFVFDLSDPKNPVLKGELKIPGYSDYLHFIDENTVIGLGKETVEAEEGLKEQRDLDFAWYQGVKIATFDISDANNPREISKLVLGDRGSDSYALHDHRAFVFDRKHNMIIIPVLIAKVDRSECEGYSDSNSCYGDPVWQGAQMIKLDSENKLEVHGEVSHQTSGISRSYYTDDAVKRSVVIEDVVITVSDALVKLNEIEGLGEVGSIEL